MLAASKKAPVDVTKEIALQIGNLVSSKSGCFSCGGSVPMVMSEGGGSSASSLSASARSPLDEELTKKPKTKLPEAAAGELDSDQTTLSKPVTIRWDPPLAQPGESRNARFPPWADGNDTGMAKLKELLDHCEPATFGRGSEDVLDESYRKASKLDSSAFASDFCPYTLGIVDTAAELLMPGEGIGWSRAVKAELYKLNVGYPTTLPSTLRRR
jgi:hypothetical protein